MRFSWGARGVLAATLTFVLATSAQAAPADLDTTFGTAGVALGPLSIEGQDDGFVRGGGVRPDGSTLLVGFMFRSGDAFIVKFTPTGQRDTSFAPEGARLIDLPTGHRLDQVAIDDSGIYMAGATSADQAFVARARLANGQLDTAWGDAATPGFGDLVVQNVSRVGGLALQQLGDPAGPRPLALVHRTTGADATLVRLSASGTSADQTFADNGIRFTGVGPFPLGLVATPLGIWALGVSTADNTFTVARFAVADGATATYGTDGRVTDVFPADPPGTSTSHATALAVDGSGRAYVGGRLQLPRAFPRAAIVRYTAAGVRDTAFGTDGLYTRDEAGTPTILSLVADAQGVLAAGEAGAAGAEEGRTLALDPDGKQLFGVLRTGAAGDVEHRFVVRNPDGRPVVGGRVTGGIFVARFGGPNVTPTVSLTGPANAQPGETFTLTATGTDPDGISGALRYAWDVDGDPGFERDTGTDSSLTTSRPVTGPFTARVQVTDASGKTSTPAEHQMTIAGNAFPTARFTASPESPAEGTPVLFDATTSSDQEGPIASYSWDFDGDGATDATVVRPSFTFAQKGTYPVTLTVTDGTGSADSETRDIIVTAAGAPPTLVDLQALDIGPSSATLRFRVQENGHPAVDPEVLLGSQRRPVTPTGTPGVFEAKLTGLAPLTTYSWNPRVTDAETGAQVTGPLSSFETTNGAPVLTADIPATLDAGAPSVLKFEAHDDSSTDAQIKVRMTITPAPTVPAMTVTFPGGEFLYKNARFDKPGIYEVKLVATDAQGVSTTLTRSIEVRPSPSFALSGPSSPLLLKPGEKRSFTVELTRDAQGAAPVALNAFASKSAPSGTQVSLGSASKPSAKQKSDTVSVTVPKGTKPTPFTVTVQGKQTPLATRDIGPRSITIPVHVVALASYDARITGVEVTQGIQREAEPCDPEWTTDRRTVTAADLTKCETNRSLQIGDKGISDNDAPYQGVRLVARKKTIVRVFAHVSRATPELQFSSRLVVKRGSKSYAVHPVSFPNYRKLDPGPSWVSLSERARPDGAAWTFVLPWAALDPGKMSVRAELTPPVPAPGHELTPDPAKDSGANDSFTLTSIPLVDTGYIEVGLGRLWDYREYLYAQHTGVDTPSDGRPPDDEPGRVKRWPTPAQVMTFGAALPLGEGDLRYRPKYYAELWVFDIFTDWAEDGFDEDDPPSREARSRLDDYADDDNDDNGCNGREFCADQVLGILPSRVKYKSTTRRWDPYLNGTSKGWFGGVWDPVAVVRWDRPDSAVHEMVHGWDVNHSHGDESCGGQVGDSLGVSTDGVIGGVGVDPRMLGDRTTPDAPFRVIAPSLLLKDKKRKDGTGPGAAKLKKRYYDFMSYCGREDAGDARWISVEQWERLIDLLRDVNEDRLRRTARLPTRQATTNLLTVRGTTAGGGGIDIVRPGAPEPVSQPFAGWTLRGLNAGGEVVAEQHVEAVGSEDSPDYDLYGQIPAAGVVTVQFVYEGAVYAERRASAAPPAVQITAPTAGAKVGGTVPVRVAWVTGDPDGDALEVRVERSTDDGATWQLISAATEGEQSLDLSPDLFPASKKTKLRVTANDGFHSTEAVSDVFTSVGQPPTVAILEPTAGAAVAQGGTLLLQASGYDDAGRRLDGKAVVWSDGKRRLGRGAALSVDDLRAGRRTLRVTVRDGSGRTASAQAKVRVTPSQAAFTTVKAPKSIARSARKLRLRLATTIPAAVRVAGGKLQVTSDPRAYVVRVRPGRKPLRLKLTTGRLTRVVVVKR